MERGGGGCRKVDSKGREGRGRGEVDGRRGMGRASDDPHAKLLILTSRHARRLHDDGSADGCGGI